MTFFKKNHSTPLHSTPLHSTHSTELFKIFFSLLTLSTAFLQKANGPGKNFLGSKCSIFPHFGKICAHPFFKKEVTTQLLPFCEICVTCFLFAKWALQILPFCEIIIAKYQQYYTAVE